jgi:CRISPR-associated protein Cas1
MTIVQHLVLDEYGAFLGKHSERLVVSKGGKTVQQIPLLYLESVTISGSGISLSADAVEECSKHGIPIYFLSERGHPYASLYSAGLTGTITTRREQLAAFKDSRGVRLSFSLISGKMQNQANLVKYMAKYRKETAPDTYEELRRLTSEIMDEIIEIENIQRYPEIQEGSAVIDDLRNELMGIEGRAAQRYWRAVACVLPESAAFPGRKHQRAVDPVNAGLNYGYGILYSQCERALTLAGLDPYAGFLHVDRPGKPSLTLDFIEEFRQAIVDRTIIGLANKNVAFTQEPDGLLKKETRLMLAEKIRERLDAAVPFEGKHYPLRIVLQMQARHVATFLRCERPEYIPFVLAW